MESVYTEISDDIDYYLKASKINETYCKNKGWKEKDDYWNTI